MSCILCKRIGYDMSKNRLSVYYCSVDDKPTCSDCVCHHKPSLHEPSKDFEEFYYIRPYEDVGKE